MPFTTVTKESFLWQNLKIVKVTPALFVLYFRKGYGKSVHNGLEGWPKEPKN